LFPEKKEITFDIEAGDRLSPDYYKRDARILEYLDMQ
jgi:hypothetical protein